MSEQMLTRRKTLQTLGGAWVAGSVGLELRNGAGIVRATELVKDTSFVDTHVHIASSQLARRAPGVLPSAPFDLSHRPGGVEQLGKLIAQELNSARVGHALCMPTAIVSDADPLGIEPTLAQAKHIDGPKLHPVGVLHPERFDPTHLQSVEAVLKRGQVKALKAYLGYLHYSPLNPGYRPYYRLAAKYDVPVIFHTGDTYSPVAKVKYAHPLPIDEIAVDFPETKFVLAHFGNPWIMDAAQVMYKNKNVWVDLSAILIGDAAAFQTMEKEGVLERTAKRIMEGIEYSEAPQRFLFGSDWPLSPVSVYQNFVRQLFPPEQQAGVLGGNARTLFRLGN